MRNTKTDRLELLGSHGNRIEEKMKLNTKWYLKRALIAAGIYIVTFSMCFFAYFVNDLSAIKILELVMVSIFMVTAALLKFETSSMDNEYQDEKYQNILRFFIFYTVCAIIMSAALYFKLKIIPIAVTGIIFTMISNMAVGLMMNLSFTMIYLVSLSLDSKYFVFYIVTGVAAVVTATFYTNVKMTLLASFVFFAVNTSSVLIVNLLSNQFITSNIFTEVFLVSIITVLCSVLYSVYINMYVINKEKYIIQKILQDNNEARLKLKLLNEKEYIHCKKIAEMAKSAAKVTGVDEDAVYAAGLYCHIGIIDNEKYLDYNVKVARKYKFPEKLVKIIYESSGVKQQPTLVESAIVLLADKCVSALEKYEEETLNTGINREIVVQQVFNIQSTQGVLNNSGLTMQEYLDVKTSFVKEGEKI